MDEGLWSRAGWYGSLALSADYICSPRSDAAVINHCVQTHVCACLFSSDACAVAHSPALASSPPANTPHAAAAQFSIVLCLLAVVFELAHTACAHAGYPQD
jgi:hypothetical protein